KSAALVPMLPEQWSPTTTGSLSTPSGFTRDLAENLAIEAQTSGLSVPIVIKPTGKRIPRTSLSQAAHKKRRLFVSLVGVFLLFLVTTGTLFASTPMGREIGQNMNLPSFGPNLFNNPGSTSYSLIVQATATAVYHRQTDGYVPPGAMVVNSSGSLNWPVGQCTYWANLRYHTLTNHWVSWNGNADQWVAGARAASGWNVSQSPHVPSIIVLMPYVQNASGYGHVAVVESINANGTVHTSNMNWFDGNGGFDKVSYVDFSAGSGVYFLWHS
ncbi:MAG: CHAP domain-containing protein, partial [Ktedonobacteraceae bacterium]